MVSAASGATVVAPDSLVSGFGTVFATGMTQATETTLPTELNGVNVQVNDSAGISRLAGLIYVAPAQINFLMPSATAVGTATVSVLRGSTVIARGTVQVQAVAPALFSANQTGSGPAAALALRVVGGPSGPQVTFPTYECDANLRCQTVVLDPGIDTPTTLEFFGTGIRGGKTVTATIAGKDVPVQFAGAQSQYPGLDQVNLPLLLTLRGAGLATVVVTVDGKQSNPVQVYIQ